jgi:hypothetical protein
MSRTSGDRKRVGFGTHITAGGIAGAMEAVRHLESLPFESSPRYSYAANHWTRLKYACSSPSPGAHRGYVSLYYSARFKSFDTTYFRA